METTDPVLGKYQRHFDRINEQLEQHLDSGVPLIKDVVSHSIRGRGKRLRPLFFVLSCQLCNYGGDDIYPLSAIFEYIHTASLLHDDVLDNAEIRRKKPSANMLWGNHAAVLVGDFIFSRSSSIALGSENIDFLKELIETTTVMTEGQIIELVNTGHFGITKEDYMHIITSKTAVLISAACSCAAIVSGAEEEKRRALTDFGLNVGISFQLIDDLLDYESSEEIIGKPVGKDLMEGKVTLPLIYCLPGLDPAERTNLQDRFDSGSFTEEESMKIIELVRNCGCLEEIRKEAHRFGKKAESCLDPFPDSQAKRNLLELTQYVIERHY